MFTLLRFEIKKDDKEIYSCKFASQSKKDRDSALSTIIIGENGSGKSYLLSQIVDFFRFIQRVKNKEKNHITNTVLRL